MELQILEDIIIKRLMPGEAYEQYLKGAIGKSFLRPIADQIQGLSKNFLSEEGSVQYLSEEACIAYALYYLPINFEKIRRLLLMLPQKFKERELRFLDVGAGPGTALFGGLGAGLRFNKVVLCEKSQFMRGIGERLLSDHVEGVMWSGSLAEIKGPFDLIVASNVISEVKEKKEDFVLSLCKLLSDSGALLLLEPGTFSASRSLMALRDSLLLRGTSLNPLFPCTHSDPCPMLKTLPNDWCHGTMPAARSRLIRDLDELTGFNKHRIKYSAFLAAKGAKTPKGLRVIGEPKKDRRGVHAMLCGGDFFGAKTFKTRSDEGKKLQKTKSFGII